jgi:hypothetical protein
VFGGIKQGSGIALGPAVSTKFGNGAYAQFKAEYSIRKFVLFQGRYDTARFWSGRAVLINRARWEDAMKLPLYRLGMDSPERHIDHSERKREFSSRLTMDVTPNFIFGAGYGVERFTTSDARIDLDNGDDVALPPIEPLPGVFTRPWYGHSFVMTAWDSRDSESYNTTGQLFEARLHFFNDWKGGAAPFQRFEGVAQQLVRTFGGRGIADVSARTQLSISQEPNDVPFFLMPYPRRRRLPPRLFDLPLPRSRRAAAARRISLGRAQDAGRGGSLRSRRRRTEGGYADVRKDGAVDRRRDPRPLEEDQPVPRRRRLRARRRRVQGRHQHRRRRQRLLSQAPRHHQLRVQQRRTRRPADDVVPHRDQLVAEHRAAPAPSRRGPACRLPKATSRRWLRPILRRVAGRSALTAPSAAPAPAARAERLERARDRPRSTASPRDRSTSQRYVRRAPARASSAR